MMLLPHRSYKVFLFDPPWRHDMHSESGTKRGPAEHYPTMSTPEIIALKDSLGLEWSFDPDSIAVMWCTWSHLARGDCHDVMRAYGFKVVTGGSWHKITPRNCDTIGLGYIFRDSCEPFLVGTRGEPGRPSVGARGWRNGFRATRRKPHSTKPDYLHRALEHMYPQGPFLEGFARKRRPGWDAFGLEVDGPLKDFVAPSERRAAAAAVTPPILEFLEANP